MLYVDNTGALSILDADGTVRQPEVDVLPDTALVDDGTGRVLFLSGPTTRYPHGVLGDEVEATQVSAIDPETAEVTVLHQVEADEVIESVSVLVSDADANGEPDVLLTVSDAEVGARLRLIGLDGTVLAESEGIGRGERWRHLIAVAPIGPDGAVEIVDVRTPHIGGVLEFLSVAGSTIELVSAIEQYGSHVIGSRNFEQAVVADGDGDGALEVILPTEDRAAIHAIERVPGSSVMVWGQPLGGFLSTNIGTLTRADGTLSLAVGTDQGILRIFP